MADVGPRLDQPESIFRKRGVCVSLRRDCTTDRASRLNPSDEARGVAAHRFTVGRARLVVVVATGLALTRPHPTLAGCGYDAAVYAAYYALPVGTLESLWISWGRATYWWPQG